MDIKEKVFDILEEMLGEDATGVYCYDSGMDEDLEMGFYSSIVRGGNYTDFNFEIEDSCDITVAHGASRLVLIPENEDFIIKLPITATYEKCWTLKRTEENGKISVEKCYSCNYNDYEIEEEYLSDGWEIEKEDLVLIKRMRDDCDLMDEENSILERACNALQELLVPNVYIGMWNNHIPVYIQKKVETLHSSKDRPSFSKETVQKFNSINKTCELWIDDDFVKACIDYYGYEKTLEACMEINAMQLTDLHSSNIGYFENGQPCIFDFAGYDEKCIWTE